jgi:hypothetical protein
VMTQKHQQTYSGWWFGTWLLWFSIFWKCHHPNWRSHIFQRGRYTTNQILFNTTMWPREWSATRYFYSLVFGFYELSPFFVRLWPIVTMLIQSLFLYPDD